MSKTGKLKTIVNILGIVVVFAGAWIFYTGCCDDDDDPTPPPKAPATSGSTTESPKDPPITFIAPAAAPMPITVAPLPPLISDSTATLYTDTPVYSSCPYLYVWNGTSYVLDNDIIPFKHPSLENSDYYTIQQLLKPEDGYYKMRVAEYLPETSYLDFVKLVTIDHPAAVQIYPDLKGNLYNISKPKPLLSCVDSHGNSCLDMLKGREEVYIPGTYFEGSPGEYIIADFGNLSSENIIKLVVTSDGLVDDNPLPNPNPSSTGPSGPTSGGNVKSIRIDSLVTQNGVTTWEARFVFTPHELWATNVFDITNVLPDADGNYKLRFFFTNTHKIDFIGIDTTPEIAKETHELAPIYARTGEDVLSRVLGIDSNYVVMKKGDELFLKFPYQPPSDRSNFKRDFVFVSRGYYIPDQR